LNKVSKSFIELMHFATNCFSVSCNRLSRHYCNYFCSTTGCYIGWAKRRFSILTNV